MIAAADVRAFEGFDDARDYLAKAVTLAGQVPAGAMEPADYRCAGVLGAGAMGRGIALAFAQTGRQVALIDPSPEALSSARHHIEALVSKAAAKGKLDQQGAADLLGRLSYGSNIKEFAGADIVVEAVPEVMDLKQKVMAQIENVVGPNTIIATNTSTLDVDGISAVLRAPGRFVGLHFFIPAQVNKLLEVIPAQGTAPMTLATAMALALDLRKNAVVAANGDGFIGNRLFDRFHQEAMYLVEEGALPEDVDSALEAWGMAIGPFRALDLVGNDIPWGVRKQRAARPVPPAQPRIGDALCEAGFYGQKTGRGWYFYDSASPKGRPYEEVTALIHQVSEELGIERRTIGADEIVGRTIAALIVEGWAMLEEGRAQQASDIDMVYVTGYGFPAAKGGPMRLGETLGRSGVLRLAQGFGVLSDRSDTAWKLPHALREKEAMA